MESLAVIAFILVSPSLFLGPIGLLLTLSSRIRGSKIGRTVVITLSVLAFISGAFLIVSAPGSEALPVGMNGIITSVISIIRIRNKKFRK